MPDVEEQEVGARFVERGRRRGAVGHHDGAIAGALEQLAIELAVGRDVVGDQDRAPGLGHRHRQHVVERRALGDPVRRREHRFDRRAAELPGGGGAAQRRRRVERLAPRPAAQVVELVGDGEDLGRLREALAASGRRGSRCRRSARGARPGSRPPAPATRSAPGCGRRGADARDRAAADSLVALGVEQHLLGDAELAEVVEERAPGEAAGARAPAAPGGPPWRAPSAATPSEWWRVRGSLPSSRSTMLKITDSVESSSSRRPRMRSSEREPGEQLGALERLVEEVVGAGLEPAHLALDVGERGEQDDRHEAGRAPRLEPAADLEAVETRHHEVEQDGVRQLALDRRQRLGAVAREGDVEALLARGSAPSSSRFSGWSSTARMRVGSLTAALRARAAAISTKSLPRVDRLRDVGVAAGGEEALAVALHGVGGDRDDRARRRARRGRAAATRARGRRCRAGSCRAAPRRAALRRAAPSSSAPSRARSTSHPASASRKSTSSKFWSLSSITHARAAHAPPARLRRRDSSSRRTAGSRRRSSGALLRTAAIRSASARRSSPSSSFEVKTTIGMCAGLRPPLQLDRGAGTVEVGHDEVEHDDGRGARRRRCSTPSRPPSAEQHFVAGLLELHRQVVVHLRVVVDHQDARAPRRRPGDDLAQPFEEAPAVERLQEVVVGAERQAEVLVGDDAAR